MKRHAMIMACLMSLLYGSGCSSDPCVDAAEALRACVAQLNCATVGPLEIAQCNSAKSSAETAAQAFESNPCVVDLRNEAKAINACQPNPAEFCSCP